MDIVDFDSVDRTRILAFLEWARENSPLVADMPRAVLNCLKHDRPSMHSTAHAIPGGEAKLGLDEAKLVDDMFWNIIFTVCSYRFSNQPD